ncbi:hypothetical protein ACHHYP_13545 [Achlya hypogyna]|uniref:Uncharacterized protein n=1 Tax=Achlya hypogyna TaxID=1202772 RepID=A0A1V9YF44_ACHHY|nr:hypothetical protein ACHHYP_13545 [Achlya hypogyna]
MQQQIAATQRYRESDGAPLTSSAPNIKFQAYHHWNNQSNPTSASCANDATAFYGTTAYRNCPTRVKLNSGRTGFHNDVTKVTLDSPPVGTANVSVFVFQHHNTTAFVCACCQWHTSHAQSPQRGANGTGRRFSVVAGSSKETVKHLHDSIHHHRTHV